MGPEIPSAPTIVVSSAEPVPASTAASQSNIALRLSQENNGATVDAVIGEQILLTLGPPELWSVPAVTQVTGNAVILVSSTGGGSSGDEVHAVLRATGAGTAEIGAKRSASCGPTASTCQGWPQRFYVIVNVGNPR
jgi:hypothetical protein